MTDKKPLSQLLTDDANLLARQFNQTKFPTDVNIDGWLSRRLKFAQHRRNFILTAVALLTSLGCSVLLLGRQHQLQDGGIAVFTLGVFVFFALFVASHDPDY